MSNTTSGNKIQVSTESSVYEAFNLKQNQQTNVVNTHRDASNEDPEQHKKSGQDIVRCTIGVLLYGCGLFLIAWGQILQPSLLLLLAGIATIILGGKLFLFIDKIDTTHESGDIDDPATIFGLTPKENLSSHVSLAKNDTNNLAAIVDETTIDPMIASKKLHQNASTMNSSSSLT